MFCGIFFFMVLCIFNCSLCPEILCNCMNIMDDVMEDFGVASFCIYKDWVGNFQLLCSVLVVSQLLVIAFLQD
jgi:hypothetical protein